MRKPRIIALAIIAALALTAVAIAAQVNTYSVTASTSPTKAGSKKKPVPTSVHFGYKVGEQSGKRPAAVKKYSILLGGISVNPGVVKAKCTADMINATGSPAGVDNHGTADASDDTPTGCPNKKAAIVGTGFADNTVGSDSDESSQLLHCYLYLKVYNAGTTASATQTRSTTRAAKPGHATLFLYGHTPPGGGTSKQGDKYCAIEFGTGIDATYVKKSGGTALEFTVPKSTLHNVPGFTTAVRNVDSVIKKITGKIGGKKHGYYESVGGCKNGKRKVSVTFTQEDQTKPDLLGATTTKNTVAKCT